MMRCVACRAGFFFLLLDSCESTPPAPPSPAFQNGFDFPAWSVDGFATEGATESLRNLKSLGTRWVAIVPFWYQDDLTSTNIYRTSQTASDESVIAIIRAAKSLGFRVVLKPQVDPIDGQFRGLIAPADPEPWFRNYEMVLKIYLDIARKEKIDGFIIGTEFTLMQLHTDRWRGLIATARSEFSGFLTYAANWPDYQAVRFWRELDFIGVDAYFPLTNSREAAYDQILAGWTKHAAELEAFSRDEAKPILFTEIGYTSQDGASTQPWSWTLSETVDLQEQADCYRAALETFSGKPWFAGMYWWNWEVDPNAGGAADRGFTPWGKPAAEILKTFFAAP